jgi:predicted metal-dependent peptidase
MADSTVIDKAKVVTVTDPRTDAAAREKLTTARIGLLLKAPFFGQLATRMTLTNADEWCGTAATDGRKFYYNSEFVNNMPLKQLEFLVGHEILHAVYDHMGRRGDRLPRLSNIAADYCVNQDLVEQRIGEKISVVPILYDNKFKGQSYEEVYDYLYKNADKINMDQLEQMVLDDHLEDGEGEGEGEGEGKDGKGRPKLSKEEAQAIRDEIKGAVIAAAQAAGAGNLPAGVKRLLKDITAPVIG